MKVVRFLLRLVGWLLTPLVAWAASFLGATAGAWASTALAPTPALWLTIGAGGVAALLGILAWLRLLRRSPRLRHALEVEDDGTPVVALEAGERSS